MTWQLTVGTDGKVQQPEGKTREYKLNLSSKDRVMQAIIAFANSAGGQLVIGVRDDLTVAGVKEPLAERQRLAHMIADTIRPQLSPPIDLVPLADETVLVVDVPLGSQRPYYFMSVGKYGGTYYRAEAGNRQAGDSFVDDLALTSQERTFDALPCVDAKMSDLDIPELSKVMGREIDEPTLRTLKLIREDFDGNTVPTNAGVLVACPNPERFLPFAWVQCARFRGEGKRNITDQANIYGPIPLAVERVMSFLRNNAFLSAEFTDTPQRREDVWSIPMDPLKELVVNALVHSSYRLHGTPIKIAFEDSQIRFESPGGLVPGMTVEKMKRGESSLRNPVLARIFQELHQIEAWGTGIPAVLKAIAAEGLPEPEFEESVERLRITVHIRNHDPRYFVPAHQLEGEAGQHRHIDTEPGVYVSMLGVYVSERAPSVLRAAGVGPSRRAELIRAADLAPSPTNYRRHILPLVEAGLLALSVPDKPRSPQQRYLLTDVGREFLVQFDGPPGTGNSGADGPTINSELTARQPDKSGERGGGDGDPA